MSSTSCLTVQPSRSRFQATSVSPVRTKLRVASSPSRELRAPGGLRVVELLAAGLFRGVVLQFEVLAFPGHPGVLDEHSYLPCAGGLAGHPPSRTATAY